MNERPLTDARIAVALRAHVPAEATLGLSARVMDAVLDTRQQRSLPGFLRPFDRLGAVSAGVRHEVLFAAVLLLALALAGVAAAGALRFMEQQSAHPLGKWQPNTGIVATVKLPLDAPKLIYWRAVTYDQFLLNEWRPSEPISRTPVAAGNQLLEGTAENQLLENTLELTFTVQPMQDTGNTVLSPATPVVVDQDTEVTFVGQTGNLHAVERREDGPYTVLARIRLQGNDPGELNAAALRSVGTDYPDDITALYLDVPKDAMRPGGPAEQLFEQLVADAPNPDNPYDFASYLETQFVKQQKDGGIFEYDTDVTDLVAGPCKDVSIVDCFAEYKRGFCQWYATTMAIFLRAQGIPARIAEGYLPGNRVAGQETIRGDSRHQWVEAYFPSFGWVMFDPTGRVSVQQPLPSGLAEASTPPLPSAAFAIPSFRDPRNQEPVRP